MGSTLESGLNWSLIAAVNNDAIWQSCVLRSPDIATARAVIAQRGFASAATAYNAGITAADSDLLVLAHQDVYFPAGWVAALRATVAWLDAHDPNWGVLGLWGITPSGAGAGFVYCGATRQILGGPFAGVAEVTTLDEVVLILRKSSGLRFDEQLDHFHMYGADICLQAQERGMKCYSIPALAVHNTNGYNLLPAEFWKAYGYMRRKWAAQLPVVTSCTTITKWGWPMLRWNLARMKNLILRRHHPGQRVSDPAILHQELLASGRLPAAPTSEPAR